MTIIFLTGGARSGKSEYALREAEKRDGKKVCIATAEPLDAEIAERIAAHQRSRDESWETREEPIDLSGTILELAGRYEVVVVDCLTLWLSNLMNRGKGLDDEAVEKATAELASALEEAKRKGGDPAVLYLISNEVGMGIVPENRMARCFRDSLGRMNQVVATAADEVYLLVSGVPLKVKGISPGAK
jgi:adenosylcobinamide kinase/adenosylcobinamide-phosphate guanylyltransferase